MSQFKDLGLQTDGWENKQSQIHTGLEITIGHQTLNNSKSTLRNGNILLLHTMINGEL